MTCPEFSDGYGLWQWKQAIAYIAFDIVQPRLEFRLSQQSLIRLYPHQEIRRELAFKAINELLSAIQALRITPVYRLTPVDARPQQLERIRNIMRENCDGGRRNCRQVLFRRQDIIAQWPTANAFRTGKISSQTACTKWLRSLAASGELFQGTVGGREASKGYWLQKANEKWPFPSLSGRSFNKAWREVATNYSAMRAGGRKRNRVEHISKPT